MNVLWLSHVMTYLDRLDPGVLDDLLDGPPLSGVWLQHFSDERATGSGAQVIDCRRASRDLWVRRGACLSIRGVQLIRCWLGRAPGQFLEVQTVVDDATSPNVDKTSIICCDVGTPSERVRIEERGRTKMRTSQAAALAQKRYRRGLRLFMNCSGAM